MGAGFETIVVLVDLSSNTNAAVKKALELSRSGSTIHLLYIQNQLLSVMPVFPTSLLLNAVGFFKKQDNAYKAKLRSIKRSLIQENPGVQVKLAIAKNISVKHAIIQKSIKENADLIVIEKSTPSTWLPCSTSVLPMQLARAVSCAVLMVASSTSDNAVKTIIVPVINNISYSKMDVIAALSQKWRISIHLITFSDPGNTPVESAPSCLLRVYQWLKTSLHCPVQNKTLSGHNKTEAIMKYAADMDADMVVLDPEMQVKAGWWNSQVTQQQEKSKISVLAVQPMGAFIRNQKDKS